MSFSHHKFFFLLAFLFSFVLGAVAEVGSRDFVLVIDPGHGGRDPGAVGRTAKEKTINLKVALELGRLIKRNCPDVKVVYTRSKDTFVSLQRRADIANKAKADLFISIHTNAVPKSKSVYGTETYTLGMHNYAANLAVAKRENAVITYESNYKQTYQGFDPNKSESYIIFEFMQDHNMKQSVNLAKCIQKHYRTHAGRKDKGVHQAGLLVLRMTTMPGVLTELGFISTPAEEKFMNSSSGIAKLARSIYNGFVEYRKTYDSNAAPVVVASETPPVKAEKTSVGKKEATRKTAPSSSAKVSAKPVFKLQILTHQKKLSAKSSLFKGLKGVESYREGGVYKYTYKSSTKISDIRAEQKKIKSKFPKAFIVAFVDGKRVSVQEALKK